MQGVVLVFTTIVTTFAMLTTQSIYDLVGSAYKITLVAAFVPLLFGVYWKRGTNQGAIVSTVLGLTTWITLELTTPAFTEVWLPHLVGFLVSLGSFILFSLLPQFVATPPIPQPPAEPPSESPHGTPATGSV